MTDDQIKALNWDAIDEARQLRLRLTALERKLKKHAASWAALARDSSSISGRSFVSDGKSFIVRNRSRESSILVEVQQSDFDRDTIDRLFNELEETAAAYEKSVGVLRSLGLALTEEV